MGRAAAGWVRGAFLRDCFDGLDATLGRERAAAVLDELGAAYVERTWSTVGNLQPIERQLELVGAIDRVLGRAAMRAWSHDHAVAVARRGAFGAIVNNAVRLFGLSLHAMSRAAARAWAITYRDMGHFVHHGGDDSAVVMRWVDAPAWVAEHGPFRASLEAALESCFTLVHREGEVLLGMSGGELRFKLTSAPLRAVG